MNTLNSSSSVHNHILKFNMKKNEIKKGKEFYNLWRQEKIFSPALNRNISVTRKGWNHITGGNRNFKDKIRRIRILHFARELIKISTTIQNIKRNRNKTFLALEHVFDIRTNYKVRVILESDDEKNYRFLSVMDKKI